MFGSLKVNGTKVVRNLTAAQALPGFLYVENIGAAKTATKKGDLIVKTIHGQYLRIHENPVQLNWTPEITAEVIVRYVNVELNFTATDE